MLHAMSVFFIIGTSATQKEMSHLFDQISRLAVYIFLF